jgi:hypothetical protein
MLIYAEGQSIKRLIQLAAALMLLAGTLALPGEAARAAEQKQPAYVASSKSEPFHKPSCEWAKKISPKNLEKYKSRDEAIKAGHRPCKVCKP